MKVIETDGDVGRYRYDGWARMAGYDGDDRDDDDRTGTGRDKTRQMRQSDGDS